MSAIVTPTIVTSAIVPNSAAEPQLARPVLLIALGIGIMIVLMAVPFVAGRPPMSIPGTEWADMFGP